MPVRSTVVEAGRDSQGVAPDGTEKHGAQHRAHGCLGGVKDGGAGEIGKKFGGEGEKEGD